MQLWHLYLMAFFYAYAGVSHFRNPRFFLSITPPWVPSPDKINIIVGVIEIALGIGLIIPATRAIAAWGVIALLIAVFPGNFYHHQKARRKGKRKMIIGTLIRMPIQLLLIWWAYSYT